MDFLRKMARQSGQEFKDLADEVWAEVGSSFDKDSFKGMERSAGKYALTAQLLMTLNFPEDATTFRDSFNFTGEGPTGAQGFMGTPIQIALDGVAEMATVLGAQAMRDTGAIDVTKTSTYQDLDRILPELRRILAEEGEK